MSKITFYFLDGIISENNQVYSEFIDQCLEELTEMWWCDDELGKQVTDSFCMNKYGLSFSLDGELKDVDLYQFFEMTSYVAIGWIEGNKGIIRIEDEEQEAVYKYDFVYEADLNKYIPIITDYVVFYMDSLPSCEISGDICRYKKDDCNESSQSYPSKEDWKKDLWSTIVSYFGYIDVPGLAIPE